MLVVGFPSGLFSPIARTPPCAIGRKDAVRRPDPITTVNPVPPVLRAQLVGALVEASAAAIFALPPPALQASGRKRGGIARARQTAIYFAHVALAMSMTRAGNLFARDRTTARHACLRIEEWRENAPIDHAFDRLDPAMQLWLARFCPAALARRGRSLSLPPRPPVDHPERSP